MNFISERLQKYLPARTDVPHPDKGKMVKETNDLGDIKMYHLINGKKEGEASWESKNQILMCQYSKDKKVGDAMLYNKISKTWYYGKADDKGTLIFSKPEKCEEEKSLKRKDSIIEETGPHKRGKYEDRFKNTTNTIKFVISPESNVTMNASSSYRIPEQGLLGP